MRGSLVSSFLLALLLVGTMLGISALNVERDRQLAQVSSINTTTGSGSSTTGTPVTFSVSVASDVSCTSATPTQSVGFFTQPTGGGYFSVFGQGGTDLGDVLSGITSFPAGIYTWEGKANAGYVRSGTYTGTFTVSGTCSTTLAPVSFSQPSVSTTYVDCSIPTAPKTKVAFVISPTTGGYVQVEGGGATRSIDGASGSYGVFENGSYVWHGLANTGYTVLSGSVSSGNFMVSSACATSGTSTNTTTTTTSAATPPPLPPAASSLSASASVSVAPSCTLEKLKTPVAISIEPAGSATVVFRDSTGGAVLTSGQGIVYLPNGGYSWEAVANPGYAVSSGGKGGTFALSSCPTQVSVAVSHGSACDLVEEGVPVTFSSTVPDSVTFSLMDKATGESVAVLPGTEYLKNGNYAWAALPRSGANVVFSGTTYGTFSVTACASSQSTYVPPPQGTPLFFRDGRLIDPVVKQGERIAVRIDVGGQNAVGLELVGTNDRLVLGAMTKDASNRWLYAWDVPSVLPGEYTIVGRGKTSTGDSVVASRLITILPADATAVPTASITATKVVQPTTAAPAPAPVASSEFSTSPPPEIVIPDRPVFASLGSVEGSASLPVRGVADLLSTVDIAKASAELPAEIRSPEDLRIFCASKANDDACLKLIPESLRKDAKETIEESRKEIDRAFTDRPTAQSLTDADADGITDYDEEHFFGTDPKKSDSNGNGVKDGDDLLAGKDPNSKAGTTTFEDPVRGGEERVDLLAVVDVSVAKKERKGRGETATELAFAGRALPNAIVTLYIHSEPVIVRFKADENGLWSYTVTKELDDGTHQAFVAVTDGSGRVLAKSAPLPFVKQAAAVSITPAALPRYTESAPSLFSGPSLYAFILIILGVLGFSILTIGVVVRSRKDPDMLH